MFSSLHARNERTVKTCFKEGENGFLEQERSPFFGIRKASSSPTIWRREGQSRGSTMLIYWAEKRPHLATKKVLFHHDNTPLIRNYHSKTGQITLRIAVSSTVFSRFGPMRFLFVPKHEKIAWWKAIHVKLGSHRRNRGLFCGVRQTIFFGWLEKVRISLD